MLLNLFINAKDAMNERGKIHIHAGITNNAHIHCSSCHEEFNGDYVVLEIKDTGPGIPEENMDKIFQPFFTTKGRAENSGLGLSVVHGIVHSQNGHIVLENSPTGLIIRIYLPPATGIMTGKAPRETNRQLTGKLRY
jgi:signal transduction histidine kinase